MVDFERRVIPTFGLQDLVLDSTVQQKLDSILNSGKTQKFISAQWGFGSSDNVAHCQGITCVLCGGPGVGKSAIAHAIAYELGQPIKVRHRTGQYTLVYSSAHSVYYLYTSCNLVYTLQEANCTELLSHSITVSPRHQRGVAAFFKDAQKANAIIVLDGAEILLGSTSSK